ncbi:MAG: Rrf2 family transcriptional regulator [Chitinivibrionales bacterium]|nr:Rrf2 family transcriptional regulator [Chitinivibrionales bacterium]
MRLSKKCRYGTRAMIEIARREVNGPVKRKHIVETEGLSMGFLENILCVLKDNGLIRTVRGARGGFVLKAPPEKITLLDVVSALESETAPVECLENKDSCPRSTACTARKAWRKVHKIQTQVLSKITLRDLVDMDKEPGTLDYAI